MLSWLERYQFLVLGLALIAAGSGIAAASLLQRDPGGIEFAYGAAVAEGEPIRVQVTGAVVSPGVYDLRGGDRMLEALAAAGGPADGADVDSLNLARRIRDEERIDVPWQKQPAAQKMLPGDTKIDINTATADELDTLEGIGEAYSRRIVDSRRVEGPYKTPQDLVDRRVIPLSVFERIRDKITAGQ